MLFVTNLTSLPLKTVKRMLYLGNGFIPILQSGSIFQFSLINISATECSLHSKNCIFLTPGYFLRAPNNLNSRSFELFLIFLEGLSSWESTLYVKVKKSFFLAGQSKQDRVGKIRPIDPSRSCSQSDHRIRLLAELKLPA